MNENPLHVQVAEALGWTDCRAARPSWEGYPPWSDQHPVSVSRYDTDWAATGPLIEKYKIDVGYDGDDWLAWPPQEMQPNDGGHGPTPLVAVCHLILALKSSGKLVATSEGGNP